MLVEKYMSNPIMRPLFLCLASLAVVFGLVACEPAVNADQSQLQTATITPGFQSQVSPIPTAPPYRCGAWTSNNAPNPNTTIIIYARLTHNAVGVAGMRASATVHFQNGDDTLDQAPTSDGGGYVS